jgi:hypothetical protein
MQRFEPDSELLDSTAAAREVARRRFLAGCFDAMGAAGGAATSVAPTDGELSSGSSSRPRFKSASGVLAGAGCAA